MKKGIIDTCCDDMSTHLYLIKQKCVNKEGDAEDKVIHYSTKHNTYSIPVFCGAEFEEDENGDYRIIFRNISSYISINYCPWCGTNLK